jgi:hypothetical protein
MSRARRISFRVLPSPETNDFEVRVLVDGQDFIKKHWPDMMGMDPDEVLSFDVLEPRDIPHEEVVIRCGCGVVGCGSVSVMISGEGDRVNWDSWNGDQGNPPPEALAFERGQYLKELEQAIADKSWETPDRTAARLLSSMVDRESLAAHGLSFQWATGRIRDDALTVSLEGPPGHHQILVHTPWNKGSPEEVARRAAATLNAHPSRWPDVWWYGRSTEPLFDGPGWRR